MQKLYHAIGLMSGTSLDGVDAALVVTDGEGQVKTGKSLSIPYPTDFRARLKMCLRREPGQYDDVMAAEKELTEYHIHAVSMLLGAAGMSPGSVDVVGFHGQTLFHAPDRGMTWQIGDGAYLAARTGIDVVNDFRSADVAAGGQGAPFVPLYHQALATSLEKPLAVLNIGGVSNVTYLDANGVIIAFDTGPGNALIDDWVLRKTGKNFDEGGALAATGKIDEAEIKRLLSHSYFLKMPPKSLDRNDFQPNVEHLSAEDGAATLTAFTVLAIAKAIDHLPQKPAGWLVTGGGRSNPAIMAGLREALGVSVEDVASVGWDGDMLEAQAFGYLAVRSLKGLPLSLPTTTGCRGSVKGGRLHRAVKEEKSGTDA